MNNTNTHTTFGVGLTPREREVLTCIADGLSTKQIAGKLFISEYTVANHRKSMLAKLGAKTSAQLVRQMYSYSVS
jgi:DNA-binding CsgD family transcriptional regulator